MVSGKFSADDAKKNALAIVKLCQEELAPSGFTHRKGTTFWRRTNLKFDVLKFDVIPRARSEKWRVPLGSFGLEPGCLFPFLPRVGHAPTDGLQPEKGFGQLRLSIRSATLQRTVKAPKIWWSGDEGALQDVSIRLGSKTGRSCCELSSKTKTLLVARASGTLGKRRHQSGFCTLEFPRSNAANGI